MPEKTELSDIAKRFNQIFKEFKAANKPKPKADKERDMFGKVKAGRSKTGVGFLAEAIGETKTSLYYMLNGERPVSQSAILGVCTKLGYNVEWVMLGTGDKKSEIKPRSTLTDISALKTKIDLLDKYYAGQIKILSARIDAQDREIAYLKRQLTADKTLTKY